MRRFLAILGLFTLSQIAFGETPKPAATTPDEPMAKSLNAAKAASFIDGVGVAWTRERKCMTCHTNVPFMLARPKIAGGDPKPMQEVREFLEANVKKWETAKPKSDYDVVATAVALTWNDVSTTGKLHPATKAALDKMWTVQLEDGSWNWPDCDWPPLEHDQFYSVAYASVAVSMAPDNYRNTPAAKKGMENIRKYLKANPTTELHHKATLLWASQKIDGLLSDEEKKAVVVELRKLQLLDGGWNLPALGPYPRNRRGDVANPMNVSDGYATGFVTFILRQTGVSAEDPALVKAVEWLKSNQRESGRWFTQSPGGSKAQYVTNVGSAFAILALDSCGVKLKAE
jgi:squalene-hopene/tetraprenyl-beta-curcumene cyclase